MNSGDKLKAEGAESLDAAVAAPDQHTVLLENERVRVLDSRVRPGETVPVHTHRWESVVYMISTGDFLRYDEAGNVTFDSRTVSSETAAGSVLWLPPAEPHAVKNIGDREIRAITVEIKD